MNWIEPAEGPSVAMPLSLCSLWEGSDPPSGGRIVDSRFRWDPDGLATDYDFACDVSMSSELGLVAVGDGKGLVFAEPRRTCFRPSEQGGTLVQWNYADSEEHVERLLLRLPDAGFQVADFTLPVSQGPVVFFGAALAGSELLEAIEGTSSYVRDNEFLVFDLAAGDYVVATLDWQPDEATSLFLCRLEASRSG